MSNHQCPITLHQHLGFLALVKLPVNQYRYKKVTAILDSALYIPLYASVSLHPIAAYSFSITPTLRLMKRILLSTLFAGLLFGTSFAQSDLVITAAYDGPLTGGTPKGVELYVINDIADLSIYGLGSANNLGGSDGEEFTFPADAATAGDFIYVSSENTQFPIWFGFAPDYTSSAMLINGDDAIELFMSGAVVDVFGAINGPLAGWNYLDGWAYRVDDTGPDGSSPLNLMPFNIANWTFSGPNALDGESTNASAATPVPVGTYTRTPLPVELTGFDALAQNGDVLLQWATASETDNAGFEIQTAPVTVDTDLPWTAIGYVDGAGTTQATQSYTFRVTDLAPGTHRFRLKQIDFDGTFEFSPTVQAVIDLPGTHALSAAYPNPFNPSTQFALTVANEQDVRIEVYDGLGRLVQTLFEGTLPANTRQAFTFEAGTLPTGLYLYRATGQNFSETRRVMLMK